MMSKQPTYQGMPLTDWLDWPPPSDGVWELEPPRSASVGWRCFVKSRGRRRSIRGWGKGNKNIKHAIRLAAESDQFFAAIPVRRYRGIAVDPTTWRKK